MAARNRYAKKPSGAPPDFFAYPVMTTISANSRVAIRPKFLVRGRGHLRTMLSRRRCRRAGMKTDVTYILNEAARGQAAAAETLLPLVYEELRALAAHFLRQERADHTLQPTALVHEAYLKLIDQTRVNWNDRTHFFAVAAQAIRRILVDHARRKKADKRGSGWGRVELSEAADAANEMQVDVLALDEALTRLETLNERQARVVQMRYFAGLKEAEVAELLGVNRSTVADDWAIAKAWLAAELRDESGAA